MEDQKKCEEIKIWLSEDKLTAFMSISKESEETTLEEIFNILHDHGIIFGINHEYIKKIVRDKLYNQDHVIATGNPSVQGADARVKFFFNTIPYLDRHSIEYSSGSTDYHDKGKIDKVAEGTVLAEIIPHTEGSSCMTVIGDEIKAIPGNPAHITAGENVILAKDGFVYKSAVSGHPQFHNGRISVSSYFEVEDVDLTTGNVIFDGDVRVKGNIRSGFNVYSEGNITVESCIHHAEVIAKGSITVKGGKTAGEGGFIKSRIDVSMDFLEGGRVEAKHDLLVRKAIINSDVYAGNSVICEETDGLISGGSIHATNLIRANILGSENNHPTEIVLGYTEKSKERLVELKKLIQKINEDLMDYSEEFKACHDAINQIKSSGVIDQDKLALVQASYNETDQEVHALMIEFKKLKEELQDNIDNSNYTDAPKLCVSGNIYPGVKITIGSCKFEVKHVLSNKIFTIRNDLIKILPYV